MLPKLYTSEEVRKMFDISRGTLHNWSNVKQILPKVKVGRRTYFKESDIENLINKNIIEEDKNAKKS